MYLKTQTPGMSGQISPDSTNSSVRFNSGPSGSLQEMEVLEESLELAVLGGLGSQLQNFTVSQVRTPAR